MSGVRQSDVGSILVDVGTGEVLYFPGSEQFLLPEMQKYISTYTKHFIWMPTRY